MHDNLSGWSRSKFYKSKIYTPINLEELINLSKKLNVIARGFGRSYGASSIQPKGTILTRKLNKILNFDSKKGIIEAQAGISIKEILNFSLKKKWTLPTIPGSKFISLGGMIATDVHGKNHHVEGSFRNHIVELKIIIKNKVYTCSKRKNKNLFNYSIGGMGLTGIIYSCKFKLKKIKSNRIIQETIKCNNLKETLQMINKSKNWNYNVAWLDTSANINFLGRSVLFRGNHEKSGQKILNIDFLNKKKPKISFEFPSWFINRFSIKCLNEIYFYFKKNKKEALDIDNFFFQLDKLHSWNLLYGKEGFVSYQCSFTKKDSYKAIKKILLKLREKKVYSFVSVIKSLGENSKYLSFGKKGFTIVFDFPIYKNLYKTLLDLDKIVYENYGDIYLTKDSRVSKQIFKRVGKKFYKNPFKKLRKKFGNNFNSIQSLQLGI